MCLWDCVKVFVQHFIVLIFGLSTKRLHFLRFVLHTIMYTSSCWVFVAVVVLEKCFVINIIPNIEALIMKSILAFNPIRHTQGSKKTQV